MTALRIADRSRPPTSGDLALAVSLLGVAVLSGVFVNASRPDTTEPSTWWHWALIASPPVLVAVRRRNPTLVVALATVAQSAIWISNLPEVLLPVVVILYTAATDDDRKGLHVAVAASAVLTVVTGIGVIIADDVTLYQLPLIVLTCGTAIVLGTNATHHRRIAEELASEMTEVRLRSEHERSQAITEERSHIARELHDVIGHTLSVIAVRAEAADRVAQNRPDAAREAVADIAGAARSALDQTRRVLAGLRQSGPADLTPAPDLHATRQLVGDLADAGVNVTLTEFGCDDHGPPAVVAGGAHRIVQESLTNAIKHGGPDVAIDVHLGCSPTELDLRVSNTLGSSIGAPNETDGAGLAGMAERAAILGGTFDAHQERGRFVVHATLPTGPHGSERTSP
ncbi:MAG: histidine kinase [Ilumatobacteraceae bacterium]